MATKTLITKSGNTITVAFERKVIDRTAYADGSNIHLGRNLYEETRITMRDPKGKFLGSTNRLPEPLNMSNRQDHDASLKGAIAKFRDGANTIYLSANNYNLIETALAELDAENPRSEEFKAIEEAQRVAKIKAEAADERYERTNGALTRAMEDPNSDL
ncbi:MAG: hypothetical protein ACOYD4_06795 [Solirubrobacterales bacterium]